MKKNGIGLTFASMGMTSFSDGPAEESKLTGVGEIRLVPDLSTKHTIPWYVLYSCSFSLKSNLHIFFSYLLLYHIFTVRTKQESMVLADMLVKPGEAWEYCPRETLRRVAKVLKDEFDLVKISIYSFYENFYWFFCCLNSKFPWLLGNERWF